MLDIIIVGSGPAGTSVALNLIKHNPAWADRILMLEKSVHPREKLCGGGITHIGQNILARLGIPLDLPSFAIHEVHLTYQELRWPFYGNPVFRIVRRDEFDHWLLQKACRFGVRVNQGEAVIDVIPHYDHIEIKTTKTTWRTKLLIAADGSRSTVRRALKWQDHSRVARLVEVLTPQNGRFSSLFHHHRAIFNFDHLTDPKPLQGYYWDFPSLINGQPVMNRGLFDSRTYRHQPKPNLKTLLQSDLQKRDLTLDDYHLKGHPIRWFDPNGRFAMPRVLLVGDAAGADPLMGEGIAFALGHGEVAAPAIIDAFARQDFTFRHYNQQLISHPLFKQLIVRSRLAHGLYRLRSPHLIRLIWHLGRHMMRFTQWHNPNFVPDMPVEFDLLKTAVVPPSLSSEQKAI